MEFVLILAVVAAPCWRSPAPLRGTARVTDERLEAERAELDALKEAKYREIRDAELDYPDGQAQRNGLARRSIARCAPKPSRF